MYDNLEVLRAEQISEVCPNCEGHLYTTTIESNTVKRYIYSNNEVFNIYNKLPILNALPIKPNQIYALYSEGICNKCTSNVASIEVLVSQTDTLEELIIDGEDFLLDNSKGVVLYAILDNKNVIGQIEVYLDTAINNITTNVYRISIHAISIPNEKENKLIDLSFNAYMLTNKILKLI